MARGKFWTPAEDKMLRRLAELRYSAKEIGQRMGRSHTSIYQRLRVAKMQCNARKVKDGDTIHIVYEIDAGYIRTVCNILMHGVLIASDAVVTCTKCYDIHDDMIHNVIIHDEEPPPMTVPIVRTRERRRIMKGKLP